jgi:2-polyprenyl-3-methyl-5-hydroxy-6-metoxy-1,4-benzoquinol methylase
MIRARHILHPLRSAHSIYMRIEDGVRRLLVERQFRSIGRGQQDHCWCGGRLSPFKWHESYGVCRECGCYVNRRPPLPQELKRLYSFDLYWHTRQRLKGYPTIENRQANDWSDGRVKYWAGLVQRYGPPAGRVVEVGCAHGVLLLELKRSGYDCFGVEPDELTAAWARRTLDLDVRSGFFPDIELPTCDLFLAFDVLEHSPSPDRFLRGVADLLNPGGVAILQTPIDRYDYEPPFGERFGPAFDDLEHLYLFTDKAMQILAERSKLQIVSLTERLWLHHEVCVYRKP